MCAVEIVFKIGNFTALHNLWFLLIFWQCSPETVFKWDRFLSVPAKDQNTTHTIYSPDLMKLTVCVCFPFTKNCIFILY